MYSFLATPPSLQFWAGFIVWVLCTFIKFKNFVFSNVDLTMADVPANVGAEAMYANLGHFSQRSIKVKQASYRFHFQGELLRFRFIKLGNIVAF